MNKASISLDVSPWLGRPRPPLRALYQLLDAGLPGFAFIATQPDGATHRIDPARLRELLAQTERESVASRLLRRVSGRVLPLSGEPVQLQPHDVVLRRSSLDDADLVRTALSIGYRGISEFEDRLEHCYQRLLGPGHVAIDIGAHTGRHALPMAVAVHGVGRVFAFEPMPQVAEVLERRVQLLDMHHVQVQRIALSDESGQAEFVVALDRLPESGLQERAVYNGPTRTERISVQLARLDDLKLPPPRFIKLDTEGAEWKVLRGARGTIAAAQPVVAFEFGEASYSAYGVDPLAVFDFFDALGYRVFGIHGDALAREAFAQASRVQSYWDYVACPQREGARVQEILRSFVSS